LDFLKLSAPETRSSADFRRADTGRRAFDYPRYISIERPVATTDQRTSDRDVEEKLILQTA